MHGPASAHEAVAWPTTRHTNIVRYKSDTLHGKGLRYTHVVLKVTYHPLYSMNTFVTR